MSSNVLGVVAAAMVGALAGTWLAVPAAKDPPSAMPPVAEVVAATPIGEAAQLAERNTAPFCAVTACDANVPAGTPITVRLWSWDADDDSVWFRYRRPGQCWQPVEGNRLQVATSQPGPVDLEFQAVDARGLASLVVRRNCQVFMPATPALRVSQPLDGLETGDFVVLNVQEAALQPGTRIFCLMSPGKEWKEVKGGRFVARDLSAGRHRVHFQAVDRFGQRSSTVTRTWVVEPRRQLVRFGPTPEFEEVPEPWTPSTPSYESGYCPSGSSERYDWTYDSCVEIVIAPTYGSVTFDR